MTHEAYIAKMESEGDWAPGWDAVSAVFEGLYPGIKEEHYGTLITSRATFGGEEYLDGYSVFRSPKGHRHILTYGMSSLYADPEHLGGEFSGWGYEMTFKLPDNGDDDHIWAMNMLGNLARYTYTQQRWFEPMQYVAGDGSPIKVGADSLISSLLIVEDTEAAGIDTLHGRVDFLQLVGITWQECQAVMADREKLPVLLAAMKSDNPLLITDLGRTKQYL